MLQCLLLWTELQLLLMSGVSLHIDELMSAHLSSSNWPYVFNLANSIIGVAVLALPFCFKEVVIVCYLTCILHFFD